jgi:hypothetical protein
VHRERLCGTGILAVQRDEHAAGVAARLVADGGLPCTRWGRGGERAARGRRAGERGGCAAGHPWPRTNDFGDGVMSSILLLLATGSGTSCAPNLRQPAAAPCGWGGGRGEPLLGRPRLLYACDRRTSELTGCAAAHMWVRAGPATIEVRCADTLPCSTSLRAPARFSEVGMLQDHVSSVSHIVEKCCVIVA